MLVQQVPEEYALGMRYRVLIPALIAALAAVPALAEEIYRWVDSSGQVHFSDVPRDGAEQVELNPAQTFSAAAATRSAPPPAVTDEPAPGYAGLTIVSPTEEETIWNTGGVITISVSPDPGLMEGHSVSIYFNGNEVEKPPQATSAQLSEVFRGEHKITADIRDASGKVLKQAEPVTFFYRQSANGARPRVGPAG